MYAETILALRSWVQALRVVGAALLLQTAARHGVAVSVFLAHERYVTLATLAAILALGTAGTVELTHALGAVVALATVWLAIVSFAAILVLRAAGGL